MKKYRNILSLSYSIAKANFKIRNEGSYLGILWYLLNPLSFFLIILYIRGALLSSGTIISYYPVYLLMGLIMMNFFNQLVSTSINLVQNNAQLIKSIKIPQETLVIAIVLQSIFSHIFELLLLIILFIYFHLSLLGIIFYLAVFIFYVFFALGFSFIATVLGAYFNDLGNIWIIFSQLLFFFTPVFYVASLGSRIYLGNLGNPLFYFLTVARDVSIYSMIPAWWMMIIPVLVSFCSLSLGILIFNKYKRRFAEMV